MEYVDGLGFRNTVWPSSFTLPSRTDKNGWDGGLDISTGSEQLYTNWEDCLEQLNHDDPRKVMRKHDVDIHLTEWSDLASNAPLTPKPNGGPGKKKKNKKITMAGGRSIK